MIKLEDIVKIQKSSKSGNEIVLNDDRKIYLMKRRTIIGLLLLIKYGTCSEADLAGSNDRLQTVKNILKGKIDPSWIKDRYGDANKPFSELWTEENITFIRAEGIKGNRQYVLNEEDHDNLFKLVSKSSRKQLSEKDKLIIIKQQNFKCNMCGSHLKKSSEISNTTFCKDRVRIEYDHRIPIEKNGENIISNYQALCHYCNKSKRQICYICTLDKCDSTCALASPDKSSIIKATNEDISDRMKI